MYNNNIQENNNGHYKKINIYIYIIGIYWKICLPKCLAKVFKFNDYQYFPKLSTYTIKRL